MLPTKPSCPTGKTQNLSLTLYCHVLPCCCGALARALRMRNVIVSGFLSSMVPFQASLQLLQSLDFSRIVQYYPKMSSLTHYVHFTKCHSNTYLKENPYHTVLYQFFWLKGTLLLMRTQRLLNPITQLYWTYMFCWN